MLDTEEIEDFEQQSDFEESEPPAFLEEVKQIFLHVFSFLLYKAAWKQFLLKAKLSLIRFSPSVSIPTDF